MAPTNAKSLMKDFRASFRRKKVTDTTPKIDKVKQQAEEELAKLVELKENIGENIPQRYGDFELLGFLRARSLNVKEAEKLLKIDISLREFLQLENYVRTEKHRDLSKQQRVSGLIGTDKEGSLIRVINFGLTDIKGFVQAISTIDNFRLFLWFLDRDLRRQTEENKKNGQKNQQMTYIINIEHLSFSKITYKPALDTALLAIKLFQDHYQNAPKMVYLVNAPSFFSSVFKMFKPVIGDNLHKKIRIFDNNGQEELLKVIDADILPACFGGNRTDEDGDPLCKNLIGQGGKIPESFFTHEFLSSDDPDVITATVPAGSFLNFRFIVPMRGSHLSWHVQAKENDISFGVFLDNQEDDTEASKDKKKKKEEDVSKMKQLTPIIRSQCHITPEIGSTIAWFEGTCILHLDNSYSWMNSKEVLFKITIVPPTEKKNSGTTAI